MVNSIFVLNGYQGLGTFFWVELFLREGETLEDHAHIQPHLEETITSFNDTYSRFREDSLLSELNRNKTIAYDYHLATMLTQAQEASRITNNVFSIFIKEALEEKGYGEQPVAKKPLQQGESSSFIIDEKTITLLGDKGIDLGGIGKGYLIDLLAKMLKETHNLHYFVINGGGDIYVTSNHGDPIELYLEHPINEGEYLGTISVKDKAFCSSSSFKRRWKKDGKEVNHFIANKEVWAASYVLSNTATIADMYATVCCIQSDTDDELENLAREARFQFAVINQNGEMLTSTQFPSIA